MIRRPPPEPVTPLAGIIYGSEDYFQLCRGALEGYFGPVEAVSPAFVFQGTDYYGPTMGPNLFRRFITFPLLRDGAELAGWKLATRGMEERILGLRGAADPLRPVNIDPGYLTSAKLVLASTKDFSHRILLRDGIFAEVTLAFRKGFWMPLNFTFPDFRGPTYHGFLADARKDHLKRLRQFRLQGGEGGEVE